MTYDNNNIFAKILRGEIQKNTKVGKIAKSYIDQGNLVPDDFILKIISKQVSANVANEGYLFDGFPRTILQAESLAKITDVSMVISIEVPDKSSIDSTGIFH